MRAPDPRVAIAGAIAALLMLAAPPARAADPVIEAAGDIACDQLPTDAATCQQLATSALIAGRPLAAVLALGDNQYESGDLAAFQQFYDPTWGRFKSITHPVIGNHEYRVPGGAGYFQYFGAAAGNPRTGYYSFDVGSWHLIALNSNCAQAGCGAGSAQEKWLKSDLARTRARRCTLAYWHQPHFSSGLAGDDDGGQNPTFDFWNDLYAAGADVVLGGHDHDYERFGLQDPDGEPEPAFGLRQFVVGTGGKSQVRFGALSTNSQVRNTGTYGVLEMTLHRSSYSWRFIPVAGKAFTDSGSERCHGSPGQPLVKLSRVRTRLSRAGSLRLFASCATTCRSRAQVTVTIGKAQIRSRRLSRTLVPLTSSKLRVKFSRPALRSLHRHLAQRRRGLRTQVSVLARAPDGSSATAARTLRLKR
jgi:acid phosphatase type 7